MTIALAIYDGRCSSCTDFKRLVEYLDKGKKVIFLKYESRQAQNILKKQFGKYMGFTLYLFENDRVVWGDNATHRVLEMVNLPYFLTSVFSSLYPLVVKAISFLEKRHRMVEPPKEGLCMFVRTNKGVHAKMTEKARREVFELLA